MKEILNKKKKTKKKREGKYKKKKTKIKRNATKLSSLFSKRTFSPLKQPKTKHLREVNNLKTHPGE